MHTSVYTCEDGQLEGGREVVHWAVSESCLDLSSCSRGKVSRGSQNIPEVLPWHLLSLELLCVCSRSTVFSVFKVEASPVPAAGAISEPGPLVEHEWLMDTGHQ